MSNILQTDFIFNTTEADRRIALTHKNLVELNNNLNGLGRNPTFGGGASPLLGENLKTLKESITIQTKLAQQEKAVQQAKQATLATEREQLKVEQTRLQVETARLGLQSKQAKSAAAPSKKATENKPDALLQKAFDDVKKYEQSTLEIRRTNSAAMRGLKKAETEALNNEVKSQVRDFKRGLSEIENSLKKGGGGNSGAGGGGFRDIAKTIGLGSITGLGVAGGIGAAFYGAKQFIDIADAAIDKSVASARSNRLLASSATEAGKAYGELSDANKKYAQLLGLSDVATARTTAKIQQLATFSGKPKDFDKLSTGFADLGAAKGIDSKDLEVLIGTILSGQDEGLNKLGISDPGQLYKAHAKEIGKTVEQLTQFEKVQAAVNAVLDKSAIFKGTATARMNSLEGQTARVSAQFDNFTTSLSNSFTQSYTFNAILTETIKLTKQLTYDTDELNKKRSQGTLTQKDISDAAAPGFLSREGGSVVRGFERFMAGFAKLPKYLSYGLADPFQESSQKFAEAAANQDPQVQQQLREDFLRRQLHAQIQLEAAQEKSAEEQKKSLDELIAKEAKRQAILEKQSDLLNSFKNPRSSTSDIQSKLQSLKNDNAFGDGEFSEAETKKLVEAGEQEISQRTAQTYQRILQSEKNNLNELRAGLANIANDPRLFFEQRESLTSSFEQKIKEVSKSLLKLKDNFRDSLTSLKSDDNPFVKLMSDFETATDSAREKYKEFTDFFKSTEIADKIAAAEKAKIQKEINLRNFDNNFDGLKLRQDARKLAATPDNQFADFQRALDRVEKKTDSLAKIYDLDKKITEADFYERAFNPNNPKSFNDSRFSFSERSRFSEIAGGRQRGEKIEEFEKRRQEALEIGIKTFDAIADVNKFKTFSLEGTGISGKGIIADKILEAIPKREDLLKQLNSPYIQTRENAQFLLGEQSKALKVKKQAEQQKLQDFLDNQKLQEFAKPFAREQIGLINDDKKLDAADKAKRRLAVADALGNDLDAGLKEQRIRDAIVVANEKEKQLDKAAKVNSDIKDAVEAIAKLLSEKGIKIDPATLPQSNVNVEVKDSPTSKTSVTRATPDDTAQGMDLSSYVQLNFMQRSKPKK